MHYKLLPIISLAILPLLARAGDPVIVINDGQFVNSATGEVERLTGTNIVVKGPPWLPSTEETGTSCLDLEDTTTICTTFNSNDVKAMKEQGYNLIRLGVIWAGGQPTEEVSLWADTIIPGIQHL